MVRESGICQIPYLVAKPRSGEVILRILLLLIIHLLLPWESMAASVGGNELQSNGLQ